MAVGAVALGGAVLGGALGWGVGMTMAGIALGWSIGMYAGQQLYGDQPEGAGDMEGPRLSDLSVQSSAYGEPITIIYGSVRAAGNIIWSAGIKEHKKEESVGGGGGGKGGGGGGGGGTRTTYSYTVSFAIGVCEGVIAGVNKIWCDGKLLQDQNKTDYMTGSLSGVGMVKSLTVYTGSETQEPDPVIESHEGEGNVPGYRGLAYLVFEDLELEDYGNRIPNIEIEVSVGLQSSNLTLDLPAHAQQFAIVGGGSLLVIQFHGELIYYDISGQQAIQVYKSTTFGSTAIGKQGEETLLAQNNDETDDPIYWLSIPHAEEEYVWYYGEELHGVAYGYVESQGVVYVLLPRNNQGQLRFYDSEYLNWQDTWFDLKDANGNDLEVEALVISDGKVIANDFDLNKVYIFSYVSQPYPERELNFDHDVEGMDVVNGNLVCTDGSTLFFYSGISSEPLKSYSYTQGDQAEVGLDAVVSDIMSRENLESSEYDASDLSGISLVGFAITKSMSAKDALKPLMRAYQFDVVEAEGQIKFLTRGRSLERSFTEGDLAAHEQGGDVPPAVTTTRTQENELPTKVIIGYQDQNADYQVATQYAKRVTQNHFNKKNIRLPIVMTASEALQIAETYLATAWAERNSHSVAVLSENLDLLPGSVIDVAGYRMIAGQMSIKMPGLIEIEGPSEEPSSYQSDAVAESPTVPEQTLPGKEPNSFSIFMNLPAMDRVYSRPGFFVAPYCLGDESNWRGAVIYLTDDGGDTWREVDSVTSQTLVASIDASPGPGPTTRWDMKNSLTITPLNQKSDLLMSASELSVLAGENTAAIGTSSGWEIISYLDVVDNGDGTYTLSGLLRGRRGTDRNVDVEKGVFVLLKGEGLAFVPLSTEDLGTTKNYKVASIGTSVAQKDSKDWSSEGDVMKPWNPVHIEGTRNDSGDITITWLRRSKSEESWAQGDLPMLEQNEKYEVDILDGSGNVLRTLSTDGEDSDQSGVTYTATQQQDDFGSLQDSVKIKIYQISDVIGRGFPGEATV